jgi:hypothetical protein
MLRGGILGVCLGVLWLAGCGPTVNFTVDGKTFSSAEDASQARKNNLHTLLSKIKPSTRPPMKARVLVVLADRKLLLDKGIKTTGNKSLLPLESYAYLVEGQEEGINCMVEALRRRRIFTEVASRRSDRPEGVTDPNFDAVICMVIKGPDQTQWFFQTLPGGVPVPIAYDLSTPRGLSRTNAWLEGVEKVAIIQLQERGKIP